MKLRTGFAPRSSVRAVLATFLVLLAHVPGWAQTLTASTNPSSGAAGVGTSYLTGSGFPAGSISGAVVHFGANCAAPEVASAPVTQVTVVASVRRFRFAIPASLGPGTYRVWVTGTAGVTPFDTLATPSCSTITVTSSVQGTASLGAAIGGATVTLVDANGASRTGTTASDGTFALDSRDLVPPLLVKVVTSAPVGSFPAGTTLYSVSADASASTRINVHVLTDLMVRSFYSAQGLSADAAFADPTGPAAAPDAAAVQALASLVIPAVQLWLNAAEVEATSGAPSNGAINLISSPFIAYPPGVTPPSGLDEVLHQIASELVGPMGAVSAVTITGGTITETISPVYGDGLITLNTVTTNSANGVGSAATFSGLALTEALQPVEAGINATLAAFANVVNTKGAALTGADLLPFFASDYLENGEDRLEGAETTAGELGGITVTNLSLVSINSVAGELASVRIRFVAEFGDESINDVSELPFKNEGGVWKLYGNQQLWEVGVTAMTRTHQGGAAPGGITSRSAYMFAGVTAPLGAVAGVAVAGPTNLPGVAIWDNMTSRPLFQGAQFFENGEVVNEFHRLSQPLGTVFDTVNALVPTGSQFLLSHTAPAFNNPVYAVTSNSFTTEPIQFFFLPAHVALSAVVNHTLTYVFSLPRTYPLASGNVHLNAQIYSGLPNDPNARGCWVNATGPLTLNFVQFFGSGQITFPADMTPCGLPGVPIAFVNVFLETNGSNGEVSLVQYAYPY
jgi:hypothetical protein